MNNLGRNAVIVAALVVLLIGGAFAYIYISGGSGEPSEEISAPTLPPRTEEATEEAATAVPPTTVSATAVPPTTVSATAVPPTTLPPTEVPAAVIQTFAIVKEESAVRFKIQEDLRGNRITVVGETQEVAGFIEIDAANPSQSRIGTIRVNMRTLATDNDFRNRAIRSQILQTAQDEFEFSDFVPRELSGLPASVTIGESFTFTVVGDFSIKGQPHEVSFQMEVTPLSETRIQGIGTATVFYKDLGLSIPSAPGVANISDDVILEIEFVAEVVES